MFTGIVEETGEIVGRERTEGGLRLRVATSFADELTHGQSVSVSGACLTVEEREGSETPGRVGTADERGDGSFELFCSEETVATTYLGDLRVGDPVNLERAMVADGRFDGHIVQGHVDGTGEVAGIERIGGGPVSDANGTSSDSSDGDWLFAFSLPENLQRYVVPKGSITVDGISLTVASLRDGEFDVAVIPATYDLTNLRAKEAGDPVHLEVDVVAKYVESLTEGY